MITSSNFVASARLVGLANKDPKTTVDLIVRSLSAKYRPDRYRRDKSVKFGTELP